MATKNNLSCTKDDYRNMTAFKSQLKLSIFLASGVISTCDINLEILFSGITNLEDLKDSAE